VEKLATASGWKKECLSSGFSLHSVILESSDWWCVDNMGEVVDMEELTSYNQMDSNPATATILIEKRFPMETQPKCICLSCS
jgi:hypothetical protein